MSDVIVSYVIPIAYIALAVAAFAAVVFPVLFMLQDIKKAKTAFIGIGAVVVVFLLCYLLAGGVATDKATEGQMKLVEASLYTFYLLLVLSAGSILYSTVSRYFK
ncbi:MAG: hypothetical protein LBR08_07585 [Bacteroidales bacterium]|jgi:uncharacterized membrane protein YozB (DUF420 family)|nr:hypothetical protein [Bacteroidales bacterium]